MGNTLEMGQLKVQDIMVSRKQVQILDVTDGLEKNLMPGPVDIPAYPFAKVILIIASGIIRKICFPSIGKVPKSSRYAPSPSTSLGILEDPLPLALRKMMLESTYGFGRG